MKNATFPYKTTLPKTNVRKSKVGSTKSIYLDGDAWRCIFPVSILKIQVNNSQ